MFDGRDSYQIADHGVTWNPLPCNRIASAKGAVCRTAERNSLPQNVRGGHGCCRGVPIVGKDVLFRTK